MSYVHYRGNAAYYGELNFFPLVYLFIMLMIAFSPIMKFESKGEVSIQKPTQSIVDSISVLFIFCSILTIPTWINHLQEGLTTIIMDPTGGLDIYHETMSNSEGGSSNDGSITNLPAIISGLLFDICIVLFYYYLSLGKRKKLIVIGLFASFIFLILKEIAYSQRGPAIDRFFSLVAFYFLFKRHLSDKINRIVRVLGIILAIIVVVFIGAITISRFANEGGTLQSVYAYSGMQNVNFSKYAFDNGGIRYGDRTFSVFKKILGFNNVPINFWEGRAKYPYLKIDDGVFIGFVGDFVLDFGPIVAFIIIVVFNLFIIQNTRPVSNTIRFHQLILLSFVINICMLGGIKLYPYAYADNLKIIVYFIAYFIFKVDYENKTKRSFSIR